MATILLIKNNDLTKNTIIGGNVDPQRYWSAVKTAQQLYIKPVLGKALYDKLCLDFSNDALTGIYLELYEDYVKQMVIHASAEIYLSHGAYMVSNNGITKTHTEDSETVSKEELDYLVEASRKLYESYREDFLDWIKTNGSSIPEWNSNESVSGFLNIGGWHLGKGKGNCK